MCDKKVIKMNNPIDEQFEDILNKYREATLDECPPDELKKHLKYLRTHGARNGLNEKAYYQLLDSIEKLLVSKNQKESNDNKTEITAINSTVVVGDSNVVANKTESKPNKPWHETATFKIIVPILIGLLVAFLGFYFHWK